MSLNDTLRELKERRELLSKLHKNNTDSSKKQDLQSDKLKLKTNSDNIIQPSKQPYYNISSLVNRIVLTIQQQSGIVSTDIVKTKLTRLFETKAEKGVDLKKYIDKLENSSIKSPEWQTVIEAIVVHESYFYRDKAQMDAICQDVIQKLVNERKNNSSPSLRIWTAACSSGEETYTVAIVLLETLLDSEQAIESSPGNVSVSSMWNIDILGTDISKEVISKAQNGRYGTFGLSAFRDMPDKFKRFFQSCSDKTAMNSDFLNITSCVKNMVRFETYNIFSDIHPGDCYDIIFCRNVLIYFDENAKRKVQTMLANALKPGGYLILGPSDSLLLQNRFEVKRKKDTLYYKKIG